MSAVLSWNTDNCGPAVSRVVKEILAQDNGAFHYIKVIKDYTIPWTQISVLVLTLCGHLLAKLSYPCWGRCRYRYGIADIWQQVTYYGAVDHARDRHRAHLTSAITWSDISDGVVGDKTTRFTQGGCAPTDQHVGTIQSLSVDVSGSPRNCVMNQNTPSKRFRFLLWLNNYKGI